MDLRSVLMSSGKFLLAINIAYLSNPLHAAQKIERATTPGSASLTGSEGEGETQVLYRTWSRLSFGKAVKSMLEFFKPGVSEDDLDAMTGEIISLDWLPANSPFQNLKEVLINRPNSTIFSELHNAITHDNQIFVSTLLFQSIVDDPTQLIKRPIRKPAAYTEADLQNVIISVINILQTSIYWIVRHSFTESTDQEMADLRNAVVEMRRWCKIASVMPLSTVNSTFDRGLEVIQSYLETHPSMSTIRQDYLKALIKRCKEKKSSLSGGGQFFARPTQAAFARLSVSSSAKANAQETSTQTEPSFWQASFEKKEELFANVEEVEDEDSDEAEEEEEEENHGEDVKRND